MKQKKWIKVLSLLFSVMLLCVGVVGCDNNNGTFYSLNDTYLAGGISYDDLLNIAYHKGDSRYNEDKFQDFVPKDKGVLPSNIETKIKRKFLELEDAKYHYSLDDIKIYYYGCYNGYYAILCENTKVLSPEVIVEEWETIAGIRFKYTDHFTRIQLWKL
jgi:hypothetical protein